MAKKSREQARKIRHKRVRRKLSGTTERPRLNVYRSAKNIIAQVIDDVNGVTIAQASTLDTTLRGDLSDKTKTEQAKAVGAAVAQRAMDAGITEVVFDRGGYRYQGRVRALADAARETGLKL